MAKAKFMNGEFSAKFKGKRRFVAEQMEAIKDYAAKRATMNLHQKRKKQQMSQRENLVPYIR